MTATPPSPEMLRMARDCFGIHADLISDDLMNRLAQALAAAYQRGREDAAKVSADELQKLGYGKETDVEALREIHLRGNAERLRWRIDKARRGQVGDGINRPQSRGGH